MLFPTVDFAIFFVLVFVGHWLLNHQAHAWKWFMIAASYVFYAWWNWRFVFLLAGVSLLAQTGAIAVARTRTPRSGPVGGGSAGAAVGARGERHRGRRSAPSPRLLQVLRVPRGQRDERVRLVGHRVDDPPA